jgi:hypothetical protein
MNFEFKINIFSVLVVVFCILLYFGITNKANQIKDDLATALSNNIDIKLNEFNKKLEVQGYTLSDSMSSLATVHYLQHQSWIKSLFSEEARQQEAQYKEIIKNIPPVIAAELTKLNEKPDNIAHIGVQIDSFDVLVEIGKNAEFKRGYLKLEIDSTKKQFYHLHLYQDELEIVEVRTEPQSDGIEYSFVTAKSKLTGQIYKTKQNLFPIINTKTGFKISPWLDLSIAKDLKNSYAKVGLLSWRLGTTNSLYYQKYELNLGSLEASFAGNVKIYVIDFRMNF